MRIKKVTRYFCDHCKRGSFRRSSTERHEQICFRNPKRGCYLCGNPPPMPLLLKVFEGADLEALRVATDGCPACILATIIQSRITENYDPEDANEWVGFDYKKEREDWISKGKVPEQIQPFF